MERNRKEVEQQVYNSSSFAQPSRTLIGVGRGSESCLGGGSEGWCASLGITLRWLRMSAASSCIDCLLCVMKQTLLYAKKKMIE